MWALCQKTRARPNRAGDARLLQARARGLRTHNGRSQTGLQIRPFRPFLLAHLVSIPARKGCGHIFKGSRESAPKLRPQSHSYGLSSSAPLPRFTPRPTAQSGCMLCPLLRSQLLRFAAPGLGLHSVPLAIGWMPSSHRALAAGSRYCTRRRSSVALASGRGCLCGRFTPTAPRPPRFRLPSKTVPTTPDRALLDVQPSHAQAQALRTGKRAGGRLAVVRRIETR